jgi:hypothetical protein
MPPTRSLRLLPGEPHVSVSSAECRILPGSLDRLLRVASGQPCHFQAVDQRLVSVTLSSSCFKGISELLNIQLLGPRVLPVLNLERDRFHKTALKPFRIQ